VALPYARPHKRLCSYAPATIIFYDSDATETEALSIVILGRIVTQGRDRKRSRIGSDTDTDCDW
jgi:hypothetical protein